MWEAAEDVSVQGVLSVKGRRSFLRLNRCSQVPRPPLDLLTAPSETSLDKQRYRLSTPGYWHLAWSPRSGGLWLVGALGEVGWEDEQVVRSGKGRVEGSWYAATGKCNSLWLRGDWDRHEALGTPRRVPAAVRTTTKGIEIWAAL